MLKYASFDVLSAVQVGGRGKRAQTVSFKREAHRHPFVYDPKPGFLYVRSRAISSRCNDNYDDFPAEEIKQGYRSFLGKPVFVNHVNDNHRRARGVIIDAALHEDANPDGSPDTWVEVLMEVDAVRFPKLAEAVIKRWIERTSMGTDVEYSICSFCGNKAATPLEYCFAPGTQVAMANGTYQSIEEIHEGDWVLTAGNPEQVSAVGSRHYGGGMTSFRRAGSSHRVTVTDEHKLYLQSDGLWNEVAAQNLTTNHRVLGTYVDEEREFLIDMLDLAPDFVEVGSQVILATPTTCGSKRKLTDEQVKTIRESYQSGASMARQFGVSQALISLIRSGKAYANDPLPRLAWVQSGLPRWIEVSDALATLLGWYVVEGSVAGFSPGGTPKVVEWTFHGREGAVVDEIDRALEKLGVQRTKRYRPSKNQLVAKVSNAPLATLLCFLGGKTTSTTKAQKRLAPEVMLMPRRYQRIFWDAYCEGDGHTSWTDREEIRTASDLLARQLVQVGARLFDNIPSLYRHENNPGGPTGREKKFSINHVGLGVRGSMHGRSRVEGHTYSAQVVEIDRFPYHGTVYNLTVEPNHKVAVEDIVTPQCAHIPKLKGKRIYRTTANGTKEGVLVYEQCLTPDTPILMADGSEVGIGQVQVGDTVLDHLGIPRRVGGVMAREVDEEIISIEKVGYWKPVRLTGNHPVLVLPRSQTANGQRKWMANRLTNGTIAPEFMEASKVRPGDFVAEVVPQSTGVLAKIVTADWIVADNDFGRMHPVETIPDRTYVPERAWHGRPHILRSCRACGTEMDLYPSELDRLYCSNICWGDGYARGNSNHAGTVADLELPDTIEMDHKFGRWCGWFLAEGSISYQKGLRRLKSVIFALHGNEVDHSDEIAQLGFDLFGLVGHHRVRGNGRTVEFFNVPLARLMRRLGDDCYTKALPDEWLEASLQFINGAVSAHSDGDGEHGGGRTGGRIDAMVTTHATSSSHLADQLHIMHLMLGHTPTRKRLDPPGGKAKRTVPGHHVRAPLDRDAHTRLKWGPWVFAPVRSVSREMYCGLVHNIEVEGTHTYVANHMAVHNCYGLKFFENSLLVEEPADPTAYFLGVDARGVEGHLAKASSLVREAANDEIPQEMWDRMDRMGVALDRIIQGKRTGPKWERTLSGSSPRNGWRCQVIGDGMKIAWCYIEPTLWGVYDVEIRPDQGYDNLGGGEDEDPNKAIAIALREMAKVAGWKFWDDKRRTELDIGPYRSSLARSASLLREAFEQEAATPLDNPKTARMLTLYHGTRPDFIRSIKADGLRPGGQGNAATDDRINLARTLADARDWADGKSKPVVEVKVDSALVEKHPVWEGAYRFKSGTGIPSSNIVKIHTAGSLEMAASLIQAAFEEEEHPRGQPDNAGEFSTKPGGGKTPKSAPAPKGTSEPSGPKKTKGKGTKKDPIKTTDPAEAAQALWDGKYVELNQPRQVSTMLDKLAKMVKAAATNNEKHGVINLCNATVEGTSLFCLGSKVQTRVEMPQLTGTPLPGSKAAERADDKGKADLQEDFRHMLVARGIKVDRTTEKASFLRATQNELTGQKVAGMLEAMSGPNPTFSTKAAPIFVSRDNYILDGHHRWAANVALDAEDNKLGNDVDMDIERVDMGITELLEEADNFCEDWGIPGAAAAEGTQAVAILRVAALIRQAIREEEVTKTAVAVRMEAPAINYMRDRTTLQARHNGCELRVTFNIARSGASWEAKFIGPNSYFTFDESGPIEKNPRQAWENTARSDFNSQWRAGIAKSFVWTAIKYSTSPPWPEPDDIELSWGSSLSSRAATLIAQAIREEEASVTDRIAISASLLKTAQGEPIAPADVDTLRDETCPICSEADTYDGDRCQVCFSPNTLVRLREGYVPIASVEVGDEVLSGDGEFHHVLEVLERDYDGMVIKMKAQAMVEPILVTPEHPFLTLQGKHPAKVDSCSPARCNRVMSDSLPSIKMSGRWGNMAITHGLDWTEARDIQAGSWLALQDPRERTDLNAIAIPSQFLGGRRNGLVVGGLARSGPGELAVTSEMLWVVGMYLAEGSSGTRQVQFSLHEKEVEYQDRLTAYFRSLGYGTELRHGSSEHGVQVDVYSSVLADWLPFWLGHGCDNKIIPSELFNLPDNKIIHLLRGILDGDGSNGYGRIKQTSKVLALQIMEIVRRLGHSPTVNQTLKQGRKPTFNISGTGFPGTERSQLRGSWKIGNRSMTRVWSADQTLYAGKVYNLRVEDDPSYVVQGVVVHNCGFIKPPDEFMDPDLDEAKRNDLRQEEDDAVEVVKKDLSCDNCGSNFKGSPADEPPVEDLAEDPNKPTAPVVPDKTPVEVVDKQKSDKPDAANQLRDRNSLPKPEKDDDGQPKPPVVEDGKSPIPGDSKSPTDEPETAPKAGDPCPECGKGKLQEAAPTPGEDDDKNPFAKKNDDGSSDPTDDKSDGEDNPFAKKDDSDSDPDDKSDKSDEDKSKKKKSPFPPKKKADRRSRVGMRPALAALVEQQKIIEAQDKRLAALSDALIFVGTLAGVESHPKIAALITADENNPAQPLPDPPSEAPTETTEEALAPEGKDDPTSIGESPVNATAPGATTDVTTPVSGGGDTVNESTPKDAGRTGGKQACPSCHGKAPAKSTCSHCGGAGYIVYNTSKPQLARRHTADGPVLEEPLDLNEVDVTAPVAGTEEVRPLNEVKTETEQRIGPSTGNDPNPAFPLQGPFAEKATTGSHTESRTIAGLRLARLRMQAGITTVADDLALGTEIAGSGMSDEAIQTEIDTLAKVVTASRGRQTTASRRLVPQATTAARAPSFQEPEIPVQSVVEGPDAGEFLFE